MRLFDVLGPVMIGPSSSHTAGAAKIGYTAQKLLGEVPARADIGLYGARMIPACRTALRWLRSRECSSASTR